MCYPGCSVRPVRYWQPRASEPCSPVWLAIHGGGGGSRSGVRLPRLVLLLRLRLRLLLLNGRRQRHFIGQACAAASCQLQVRLRGACVSICAVPLPAAAAVWSGILTHHEANPHFTILSSFPQGAHEPVASGCCSNADHASSLLTRCPSLKKEVMCDQVDGAYRHPHEICKGAHGSTQRECLCCRKPSPERCRASAQRSRGRWCIQP